METDLELGKEMEEREKRFKVRKETLKAINRYHKWVDEVREKEKGWRPKKPEIGRRKPFYKSNVYLSKDEADYEKYPELQRKLDAVENVKNEEDSYLGPTMKI